jgi:opacity protein-like surface antigen
LPNIESERSIDRCAVCCFLALLFVTAWDRPSHAEPPTQNRAENAFYTRRNTLGVFSAYSNDSSHILLGVAENRKLLDFGVSYSRRLVLTRWMNWQYDGEVLPVALESDPLSYFVDNQTAPTATTSAIAGGPVVLCSTSTRSYTFIGPDGVSYSGTESISCRGREWTVGEAMSPLGLQWNFLPEREAQPFADGHGGYMYSTRPIPISSAGSFNFTFDLGAGIELYRSKTRSIRVEYRYHHVSNKSTAPQNPGIDNGLFQVTYCFGR